MKRHFYKKIYSIRVKANYAEQKQVDRLIKYLFQR